MRTSWTRVEIESILLQLNKQSFPFNKYSFSRDENGFILLGAGASANVFEMERDDNPDKRYAIKVIGFGDKHVDSNEFQNTIMIQKELSQLQEEVVKIFDYVELWICIDDMGKVLRVAKEPEVKEANPEGNYLNLKFILMEKLSPVLITDKIGRPRLCIEKLVQADEMELMKLAHNIGVALERAHAKNFLHRDIKLENVFYDKKKKIYKLGDFGIAKMTDDGMASTVAFTKGYGAPEVMGAIDERYDNTADIYSLGMMLYLLINELKFPDSKNYNVNVSLQYSKGYVFPSPKHVEYKLWDIVRRMCQYDPDERYQSMDEVLQELEGLLIGNEIKIKKGNQKATYIAGVVFYIAGVVLWKLTHMPELTFDIDILGYIVLGIAFCTGSFFRLAVSGIVIIDFISHLIQSEPNIYIRMMPYRWCVIVFLSFSVFLMIEYWVGTIWDVKVHNIYFKRNRLWQMSFLVYTLMVVNGVVCSTEKWDSIGHMPMLSMYTQFFQNYDGVLIGITGLLLTCGWMIREKVLGIIKEM